MFESSRLAACLRRAAVPVIVAVLLALPAAGAAATGPYVSLGDSYTSAPLVPEPTGNPILCGRSTNNYPSDVARVIHPSSFTDVSCGSATTAEMTSPQNLYNLQTNPPQFGALSRADRLVSVGIGGNDAGLIGIAEKCAQLDATSPTGTACKDYYNQGGSDPNVAAVDATGPKVATVIRGIHQRAPQARVFVVGYPDGLPVDGSSCWPLVPLSPGDIQYFNSLEQRLNQVIAQAAASNRAQYVDTFASSIGHDACKLPGVAWVNGIVPNSIAFPLHPNAQGEQNMANQMIAALRR
jgi:lysophospholipase L1-like esterase